MTKKLKWRLGRLPTVQEVITLIDNKLLTEDEAKDILFNSDKEDTDSLKEEIKFLKQLVDNLSKNNSIRIIETVREVEKPYYQQTWYKPYQIWCSSGLSSDLTNVTNVVDETASITGNTPLITGNNSSFSEIKPIN